jgi:DNA mismatch repair protein MutH
MDGAAAGGALAIAGTRADCRVVARAVASAVGVLQPGTNARARNEEQQDRRARVTATNLPRISGIFKESAPFFELRRCALSGPLARCYLRAMVDPFVRDSRSSRALADPPATEAELFARAERLAGETLGAIARALGVFAPDSLTRHKGWVGNLLERALGASAGSRAQPDFEALGVELKTLPIDAQGRPLESTFVCTIPLTQIGEVEWDASRVRRKLARVLWMPVEGTRAVRLSDRRVGAPLLWSPNAEELALLRFDWEELAGLIGRGGVDTITGHLGRCLQIRPKARDSRARRGGVDADGGRIATLPRGFYLRATFTQAILRRAFVEPR